MSSPFFSLQFSSPFFIFLGSLFPFSTLNPYSFLFSFFLSLSTVAYIYLLLFSLSLFCTILFHFLITLLVPTKILSFFSFFSIVVFGDKIYSGMMLLGSIYLSFLSFIRISFAVFSFPISFISTCLILLSSLFPSMINCFCST